ncbi:protein of unknown function (DUF1996) domain containing protein [Rhypophila decipiens]
MKWLSLALAMAGSSEAYLRFGCGTLTVERLDPIVEPGKVPSSHVHQIVGGNAFNASMDPAKGDIANKATCTTCQFTEDLSNYWTAVMYFRARNGSYKRVPQYPNALLGNLNGGMTVYYLQQDFNSNKQKVTSFKPGFRMTVGSPGVTKNTHPGLRYTCLQDIMTRGSETYDFPTKPCPAGIMAIHHFPACWDGKNLDSPNHQDHMYNTVKGGFMSAGACPSSHPVRMPQVALETMWNTTMFNDKSLWPADGSQPFVWSYDDSKGSGTHGDYLFGWKGDALQRTMDSTPLLSNGLKTQSVAQQNACNIKPTVKEEIDGWLTHLPGSGSMSGM